MDMGDSAHMPSGFSTPCAALPGQGPFVACSVPGFGIYFHQSRLQPSTWPPSRLVASRASRERVFTHTTSSVYGGGTEEANTVAGPGWLPHKISIHATLGWKTRGGSRARYKSRSGQDLVQTEKETGSNTDCYFVSPYYILGGTERFPGIISVISSTQGSKRRG